MDLMPGSIDHGVVCEETNFRFHILGEVVYIGQE